MERLPFSRYDQPAMDVDVGRVYPKHGEMFYVFIPLPDEGIFIATAKRSLWEMESSLFERVLWMD